MSSGAGIAGIAVIHPVDKTFKLCKLDVLTSRIRRNIDSGYKCFFEVGCDLIEAKEHLPYGQFEPWLRHEFHLSKSTAQRYMRYCRAMQRLTAVYSLERSALICLPMEAVWALWDAPINMRDMLVSGMINGCRPTAKTIFDYIFGRNRRRPQPNYDDLKEKVEAEFDAADELPLRDGAANAAREAIAIIPTDSLARFKELYAKAGTAFDIELFPCMGDA